MSEKEVDAYPLTWPQARPRTERHRRELARFDVTFARARDDVIREVELLTGTRHGYGRDPTIMSTNIALRRDGLPLAGQRQPDDPGVAVYFKYNGVAMALACDRWTKVEDNLRAIAKTVEALRGIARWGTGDMLKAAFTGFTALPAPGGSTDWRAVLGVPNTVQTIESLREHYRRARSQPHRDGDATARQAIDNAFEQAQRALGFT